MTIELACVEPSQARLFWDRVRPLLEAGYAAGDDFVPDDMLDRLRYGRILLWIATDGDKIFAAMTTELVPMVSGLVCWMCQCGGERLSEWRQFHQKIEEYARAEGCVKVVLRGRVGWQRVLPGYQVRTVQLEKTL